MLVTNAAGACCVIVGIAFVGLWLSPLEAETLNVGHLLRLDEPERRASTSAVGLGACVLGALITLVGRTRRKSG